MFTRVDWKDTSFLRCKEDLVEQARKASEEKHTYYLEYSSCESTHRESLVSRAIENYLRKEFPTSIVCGRFFDEKRGEVHCVFIFGKCLEDTMYWIHTTGEMYELLTTFADDSGDINALEDEKIRSAWYDFCQTAGFDENDDTLYDRFEAYCLSEAKIGYFEMDYNYDEVINELKN